jgi:N6-L-threonylcarbamoyladenine synthase
MTGWNFSFSGLKTAFLYFLRRSEKENDFHLESEIPHLAASVQHSIVNYLLHQFFGAMEQHPAVRNLAIVGGVSANRELRKRFLQRCNQLGLVGCIPSFAFCTDNAAMIAYAGWQKLTKGFIEDPYTQPFASA